jgi:hypothetical protein
VFLPIFRVWALIKDNKRDCNNITAWGSLQGLRAGPSEAFMRPIRAISDVAAKIRRAPRSRDVNEVLVPRTAAATALFAQFRVVPESDYSESVGPVTALKKEN